MAANRALRFILRHSVPKEILSSQKVKVPDGVVLLTIPPVAVKVNVPSISPPCLKLETYLRMARIPHKVARRQKLSSKGQVPWITYNKRNIADSNFCVKFLNEEFDVDLNRGLTESEKAVAHSLQVMVEQNTYWSLAHWRWMVKPDERKVWFALDKTRPAFVGDFLFKGAQKRVSNYLHGQGMGRHSMDEIVQIISDDFQAVSDYLGSKPFVMGQEPSQVDASVFGLMANLLWQDLGSPQCNMLQNNFKNIKVYCERMKERFWSDWDSILTERKP